MWAGIPKPSPCLHHNPRDLGGSQQNRLTVTEPWNLVTCRMEESQRGWIQGDYRRA